MNAIERFLRVADRFQQRWPVAAFPVAVWTKFKDDQAGNLAALISYYAFAALFPLLLVLVTVLNIILANNPGLQNTLVNSALAQYPVIGQQIKASLGSIPGTGLPLVIGVILLVLGARGVAGAMQNALCEIWGISKEERPGLPLSQLWAMALMCTVGIGFIATTFLSGLAGGTGHLISGAGAHVGAVVVSLILNVGMFWLGFRLAVMFKIPWRELRTGAIIAAVCWQVLQVVGGYVVGHQLHRASELYGTFGIVLGLLAWLYLQAEVTIYAAEADVVLARRLWPRSILPAVASRGDDPPYPPMSAQTESIPGDTPPVPRMTEGAMAKTAIVSRPQSSPSPGGRGPHGPPDVRADGEHPRGDAPSLPRTSRPEPTEPAKSAGGEHNRTKEPSSLEGQPGRVGQAVAGEHPPVPPPRDKPTASDKRAAGQ